MVPHKATVIKNNLPEFSSYVFGLPNWIHDCHHDSSAKTLYLDFVPHWRYATLLRGTQKHTQEPLGCPVQMLGKPTEPASIVHFHTSE